MLGVVSICCFIATPAMASSKEHGEKSSKSRSTTTECTTRGTAFTPAYATLIHNGPYPAASLGLWINTGSFTLPFTALQTAKNITLDTSTTPYTTFILPKGVYTIDFQFVVITDPTGGPVAISVDDFRFTKMYLDVNNGSSVVPLDWALKHDASQTMMTATNNSTWASVSGSRIFSIGADNTPVKIVIEREFATSVPANIRLSADLDFYTGVPENEPVRVSIHKIDGCA